MANLNNSKYKKENLPDGSIKVTGINTLLPGAENRRLTDANNKNSIEYIAGEIAKKLEYLPYENLKFELTIKPKLRIPFRI